MVRYLAHSIFALSSDKHLSKLIFKESGIKTPDWITLKKDADIPKEINFPVFVKPCSSGSSVGISLARNEAEFKKALRKEVGEGDYKVKCPHCGTTINVSKDEYMRLTEKR